MKSVVFILAILLLASCGGGAIHITQPPDGQTYALGSFTCFDVTLDNYSNTTIDIRGADQLSGQLQCANNNNGPARCCQVYAQGGQMNYSYSQYCIAGHPCTLTIIASRGDYKDIHTVSITQGGAPGTTPTPTTPH